MKVILSENVVPLFRFFLFGVPKEIADSVCKNIQAVVDMQSFECAQSVDAGSAARSKIKYSDFKKAFGNFSVLDEIDIMALYIAYTDDEQEEGEGRRK